jgi:hypothetical protein
MDAMPSTKIVWEIRPSKHRHTRAAVLNVWPVDMILVKENIIQLAHIDHFAALLAFVEVTLLSCA